jgi:hypothetical protein
MIKILRRFGTKKLEKFVTALNSLSGNRYNQGDQIKSKFV